MTCVYALPVFSHGNGLSNKVLGGWSLSGEYIYQSGTHAGDV